MLLKLATPQTIEFCVLQNITHVRYIRIKLPRRTYSQSLYLVIKWFARFMETNLLMMAIASMPSSSSPYNSAHISMREATGILWSSGNNARSMKHSLMMGLSCKTSKIFWNWVSNSVLESSIEWSSDSSFNVFCHNSLGWWLSDVPITLMASGKPLQFLTTWISVEANTVSNQRFMAQELKCLVTYHIITL